MQTCPIKILTSRRCDGECRDVYRDIGPYDKTAIWTRFLTLPFFVLSFVAAMPSTGESAVPSAQPSIFLSYASEDRTAATSIRDAMAATGLDVWYDANELGGGDAWDKKIRQQIRECDYFMALISARTEARHEGYFRREWRLAVERTLDMADDHPFLLPVVIDDTDQSTARVPEKFLTVQWLKVPGGVPTPSLTSLCNRLISGRMLEKQAQKRPSPRLSGDKAAAPPVVMPTFPIEEPGQRVKFWVHVVGWALKSAWIVYKRLPRWARAVIVLWIFFTFLVKGCDSDRPSVHTLSPETDQKLGRIAEKYQGNAKTEDVAKLGLDIAHEFAKEVGDSTSDTKAILAVPFRAAPGDISGAKLADSTFALLYGRLSISRQGQVGLGKEALPSMDAAAATEQGRASHSNYVVCGDIEGPAASSVLNVEVVKVSDGSIAWTKNYPVAGADSAVIAAEIEDKVPASGDN
jgi:TolB-like protein